MTGDYVVLGIFLPSIQLFLKHNLNLESGSFLYDNESQNVLENKCSIE